MPDDLRAKVREMLSQPTFMGGQAQRIQHRLKPSNLTSQGRPQDRLTPQTQSETNPTRCLTTVYAPGGSARRHGGG
jgi:hypothetical protein